MDDKCILLTGGAGFIGSAVIRQIIRDTNHRVINLDKLTYAGSTKTLISIANDARYKFIKGDICNSNLLEEIFDNYKPYLVMHLAAESHVDRSINDPSKFISTNIIGTYRLLEATRKYFHKLSAKDKSNFKFHHISTDEVYGDLKNSNDFFTEETAYAPSSPYSASKASSDHLVRAWHRTYKIPTILTNCSNNYGPFQYPEKLIPHMIINALQGKKLPIYGKGDQVRDWLYVEDHAKALLLVAFYGNSGKTYNIGGHNEKKNIEVVKTLCALLEEFCPLKPFGIKKYFDLITFVQDRPGHDMRYAIDATKIYNDLKWQPEETFETGMRKTVKWYLQNKEWWQNILRIV